MPPRPPKSSPRAARAKPPRRTAVASYLEESERPGVSLLLLLPFIAIYELYSAGVIGRGSSAAVPHITAFLLLEQFFAMLGAAGRHLPAIALVAMLLSAHVWRKDPWRVRPATFFGMLAEAILWALPLLLLGWVMARHLPLADGSVATGNNAGARWAILCVGAGVYEEMVFRLIGVSVLLLILKDLMRMPAAAAYAVVLMVTAAAFAAYHYLSPGEDFRARTAIFRTVAGLYFGGLFVARGFAITSICHVTYDIVVVGIIIGR